MFFSSLRITSYSVLRNLTPSGGHMCHWKHLRSVGSSPNNLYYNLFRLAIYRPEKSLFRKAPDCGNYLPGNASASCRARVISERLPKADFVFRFCFIALKHFHLYRKYNPLCNASQGVKRKFSEYFVYSVPQPLKLLMCAFLTKNCDYFYCKSGLKYALPVL